jgi:hypothetical protein
MKTQAKATGDDCPECLAAADQFGQPTPARSPLVFVPGTDTSFDEPGEPGEPDAMWCSVCRCEWPVDYAREFPPERNRAEMNALFFGAVVALVFLAFLAFTL